MMNLERLTAPAIILLTPEQRLTADAWRLWARLTQALLEARLDFNHDRFRRLATIRRRAAVRLERRWSALVPRPSIRLGNIYRTPKINW